jgi:aminopeptidase C
VIKLADVAIGGALPVGDSDGLSALASSLIEHPAQLRVMLAVIDCQKITTKTDSGEKIATVRVRRIEQVLAEDLTTAEKLLRRALESRTGQTTLPLDLEDEIAAVFKDFDPDAEPGQGGDEPKPPKRPPRK